MIKCLCMSRAGMKRNFSNKTLAVKSIIRVKSGVSSVVRKRVSKRRSSGMKIATGNTRAAFSGNRRISM